MKKRLFGLILALAMVIAIAPMALATSSTECPGGDSCRHVAAIGEAHYGTLQEAVDAVVDNTATTIELLGSASGNGVRVPSNKNITFDLNTFTYNIDGDTVGSPGTATNGFQLLRDSTITFKNGKLTSTKAIILIQNYSNLTLEDMELDGTSTNTYVLSNSLIDFRLSL